MRTKQMLALTATTLFMAANTALASLIVYEGFDYTLNSALNGQNGGTGWDGAWESGGGSLTVGEGLTAPAGFPAGIGGSWQNDSSGEMSGGNPSRVYRDAGSDFMGENASIWYSVLVNTSEEVSSDLRFYALAADIDRGAGFFIDRDGDDNRIRARAYNSQSAGLVLQDGVNLVLGRLDFGGEPDAFTRSVQSTIWLNPDLSAGLDGLGPGVSSNVESRNKGAGTGGFGYVETWTGIYIRGGTDFEGNVDEIRIATDFATAIPEPSTLALIGITLGSVVLFRRRK
jgi:hypothetical protein